MFSWLSDLLNGKSKLAKETDALADTVAEINVKLRSQCGLDVPVNLIDTPATPPSRLPAARNGAAKAHGGK